MDKFTYECCTCKHCDIISGSCMLQDFDYCVSCPTWEDVYKTCPLNNKEKDNGE